MKIKKISPSSELTKKYGFEDDQTAYDLSGTQSGISGLLSLKEIQQIYEFQQHQLDCEYVQDAYSLFTERDLADSDIARFAKAMREVATQKNISDYEALEIVIESADNSSVQLQ